MTFAEDLKALATAFEEHNAITFYAAYARLEKEYRPSAKVEAALDITGDMVFGDGDISVWIPAGTEGVIDYLSDFGEAFVLFEGHGVSWSVDRKWIKNTY